MAINVTRDMGRTVTGDVIIVSDVGLTQIADVSKIVGSLTISGPNVTSTDLRELPMLAEVTKGLSLNSLPALTTLAGLASLSKVGTSLSMHGGPAFVNPALPPLLTDLPFLSIVNTGLSDLTGFSGLTHIGLLQLQVVPVGSLDPLRRTFIDGGVVLNNLSPGLTSLSGLRVSTTLKTVLLGDLPNLTDVTAFDAVTDVDQLNLTFPHFSTPTLFPSLRKVSQRLDLTLDAQSPSYTFPALQVVRSLGVSLFHGCQGRTTPFSLGLPALQTLDDVNWRGPITSALGCFTLPAPLGTLSLNSAVFFGGGITSVTLAHVQNSGGPNSRGGNIGISGPDLTQVRFSGSVNINGILLINQSPNLRSVSFGGSVTILAVPQDLNSFGICDNASLTTITLAAPAQVIGGMARITGNPNFVPPRNFPLTATGGVIISPTFNARC